MNLLNNMEAIFIVASVLATGAALTSTRLPSAPAQRVATTQLSVSGDMPIVVVSAKRLGAAEKAALI